MEMRRWSMFYGLDIRLIKVISRKDVDYEVILKSILIIKENFAVIYFKKRFLRI